MPEESSRRRNGADNGGPYTRGGWTPAGTATARRVSHASNGTTRGRRSRQSLIDAARRVFERSGYVNTTIDDIITEAGVARGSFYTYFPDKLSIFQIVTDEVNKAVTEAVSTPRETREPSTIERLRGANRRFVEAYRLHAALYGLLEQVATIDPVVQARRMQDRQANVTRVAGSITRWQQCGIADPAVDASATAALLVSMISNSCYWRFVAGESGDQDDDSFAAFVTSAWVRVLDLRTRPRPSWVQTKNRGPHANDP